MYEPLFTRLADAFHLVAPDYPGFGHSDAPDSTAFDYTFDNVAQIIERFTEFMGIDRYSLFLQDYGGPVGFRLALARPDRLTALVIQNAVAHEDGLGPLWQTRRDFWADRPATRPLCGRTSCPWTPPASGTWALARTYPCTTQTSGPDEFAFLSRPGRSDIQMDLFYGYRTNVANYPVWQHWLRRHHPPLLVVWGRFDPSFQVEEAEAYRRDVPSAEVHILDAGHFALDEQPDKVARLTRKFLLSTNS